LANVRSIIDRFIQILGAIFTKCGTDQVRTDSLQGTFRSFMLKV